MAAQSSAGIVVVYNPAASGANETQLRRVIERHFSGRRVDFCTCSHQDDMSLRLAPWLDHGVGMVIAAGGDGTISDIADALVKRDVVLGILPQGTGNVLARELNLPLKIDAAAALLAGDFKLRKLDILRAGGKVCLLGVSVGLSARALIETGTQEKKLFGPWSYWLPFFRSFFGPGEQEFQVELDGKPMSVRATDVLAMNVGTIGFRAIRWGLEVQPDDGILNLCYLHARTGLDYLWPIMNFFARRYIRNQRVDCLPAQRSIRILSPEKLPVQGDGDMIGHTPIQILLEAAVLNVAVAGKE